MTRMWKPDSDLRDDVREAIERTWPDGSPDGVVEMAVDFEESYFVDVYPKLAAAFQCIKGAQLVHEIEPESEPVRFDDSYSGEDLSYEQEHSRPYHLFFICPEGEIFTYKTEMEPVGEPDGEEEGEHEWPEEAVAGEGRTGWSVAVSLLAPFAVVTLSDRETFEDGFASEPAIESKGFTETSQRIDPEVHFRKSKGEPAFEILMKLRGRIFDILDKHGIGVLPEEEWRKLVPWLEADEEILVGTMGEPVRVLDAFFFEGL